MLSIPGGRCDVVEFIFEDRDPYTISKLSAKYQFCAIHTADNTDGKSHGRWTKFHGGKKLPRHRYPVPGNRNQHNRSKEHTICSCNYRLRLQACLKLMANLFVPSTACLLTFASYF